MKSFTLKIAKLDKELFDGEVVSLTVPAESGEMTLLANHTPTIAKLKAGTLRVKVPEGQDLDFEIQKGFLEFSNNTANVLLVEENKKENEK